MKQTTIAIIRKYFLAAFALSLPTLALAEDSVRQYQMRITNFNSDTPMIIQAYGDGGGCFDTWDIPKNPAVIPAKAMLIPFTLKDKNTVGDCKTNPKYAQWKVSPPMDSGAVAVNPTQYTMVTLHHKLSGAYYMTYVDDDPSSAPLRRVRVVKAFCNNQNCFGSANGYVDQAASIITVRIVLDIQ